MLKRQIKERVSMQCAAREERMRIKEEQDFNKGQNTCSRLVIGERTVNGKVELLGVWAVFLVAW